MICRRPRNVPRRSASHLMKQFTTRPLEVAGPRPLRQLEPGVADRVIDAVDVECIAHDRMADAEAPAGAGFVAEEDHLRFVQFDARRA